MDAVEGDDGGDARTGRIARAHVGDQVAADGFADERDALGINFVFGGVRLEEANGLLDVVSGGGKVVLRGQAVIDAEPGKAGITQRLEE